MPVHPPELEAAHFFRSVGFTVERVAVSSSTRPAPILDVLDEIRSCLAERQRALPDELTGLRRGAGKFGTEIGRVTDLLASGTQSSSVIGSIAEREE